METFKIRCSQIGQIMGKKGLGTTGETYLKNWCKSKIFNRSIDIKSKFLSKGSIVEYESIGTLSEYLGIELYKNKQFFENEYLMGTPDIILEDMIIDIKNSWDFSTFPFFDKKIENESYIYQLQGYMELTGKRKAQLIYILSDTPDFLIEKEAMMYIRSQGYEELDLDIYDKFHAKMTYSDIEISKRIKVFEIEYNSEIIESIYNRVQLCRNYIDGIVS